MIPKVKTYQITTDDGAKHLVDAPTKLLAKLNFRHAGNYDSITSSAKRTVKAIERQMSDDWMHDYNNNNYMFQ